MAPGPGCCCPPGCGCLWLISASRVVSRTRRAQLGGRPIAWERWASPTPALGKAAAPAAPSFRAFSLPAARRPPPARPRLLRSCVTTAPSSSRRHPRVLRVASATCNLGAVTSRGWRGRPPRGTGAGALGVLPRRRLTARLLSSLPAGGRGGHGHVHGRGHLQGPAGRRLQEEGGRVHHRGREQRQVLPAHVRTGPHAPGPPQGEPEGRAAPAATRSDGRHGAGGAPGLWAQSQAHGVQGSSGLHQGVPWPLLGCPEGQDTSRHPVLRPTPGATGCVEAALAAVLICLAGTPPVPGCSPPALAAHALREGSDSRESFLGLKPKSVSM